MSTQYVVPGACLKGDDFQRCALDGTFCNESLGEEFVTPAKLELKGLSINCKNVENIAVGKCYSALDDAACTGHSSSCILPDTFISADSNANTGCSVTHNKNPENPLPVSVYGACIDKKTQNQRCYWSMDDCPDVPEANTFVPGSSQHLSAQYSLARLCTCDKTLVGACQYPAGYTCAVSPDACDVSGQYISAVDMSADPSAPTCYLCAPFGKSNFGKYEMGTNQQQKKLIIVGSIVLLLLVVLAVAFIFQRSWRRRKTTTKELDSANQSDTPEFDVGDFTGTQVGGSEAKLNPIT